MATVIKRTEKTQRVHLLAQLQQRATRSEKNWKNQAVGYLWKIKNLNSQYTCTFRFFIRSEHVMCDFSTDLSKKYRLMWWCNSNDLSVCPTHEFKLVIEQWWYRDSATKMNKQFWRSNYILQSDTTHTMEMKTNKALIPLLNNTRLYTIVSSFYTEQNLDCSTI